jgi:hypothetical protein
LIAKVFSVVHTIEALLIKFGLPLFFIFVDIDIDSILIPTRWILPRLRRILLLTLATSDVLLDVSIVLNVVSVREWSVIQLKLTVRLGNLLLLRSSNLI